MTHHHGRVACFVLLLSFVLPLLVQEGFEARADERSSSKPWLFFDLGNTLVANVLDPVSHDIARLSWVRYVGDDGKVTDAHEYLARLRAKGYTLGLVTNIPQSWGDPDLSKAKVWLAETDPVKRQSLFDALTRTKIGVLGEFFEGRGPSDASSQKRRWGDEAYPTMDWTLIPTMHSFVPFFDEYRKPDRGPYSSEDQLFLFQQAMRLAGRAGARVVYQGDNKWEIDAAQKVGLAAKLVPYKNGAEVQSKGFFLNEAEIGQLAGQASR